MIRKLEIVCIYLTGFLQGLVLVTVPAASLVFTDPTKFSFSSSEYGLLFIPQVLAAIAASLLGPFFVRQWGKRTVYRTGLAFNILAMALIASSQMVLHEHTLAFVLVILGTSLVGAGFGTILPTINVYATDFFPNNSASALTVLHTLLGIGTAAAPFLVTIFVKQIGWWVLPVLAMAALLVLLAGAFILFLKKEAVNLSTASVNTGETQAFLPVRVRLFMLTVLLYGFCETIFANWAIIFLNKEKAVSVAEAGYALTAFWIMVSVGRLLISILSVWVSPKWVYRILPIMITMSFVAVTKVTSPIAGILIFALAGLSISGFFPLTFSLGQKGFESIAPRVSGWIMASYMVGYGIAAYGVGKMIDLFPVSLGSWYIYSTIVALVVVLLSFILTEGPGFDPALDRGTSGKVTR